MKSRPLWPLLPPAVILGMMVAFVTVAESTSSPDTACAVQKLTDLHCPGCGGTRCANNIMRGDLLSALSNNAMLFSGFVIILLASVYLVVHMTILGKPAPRLPQIRPLWLWMVLAGVVVFTLLHNIPQWPFSLLAP